jgi:hypothetical protein
LTRRGTTSVRMGMGGRYLATSCAVRPAGYTERRAGHGRGRHWTMQHTQSINH